MNTSMLEQELAPLDIQLEQARLNKEALEVELRAVETELNAFSADRARFDALREVCDALDKLRELKADGLFWEGIPGFEDPAGHIGKARAGVARFEEEISGILEIQRSLRERLDRCLGELDFLNEEVRDAYEREERRRDEFAIERDISSIPYRAIVMPWTREAESEKRFRRSVVMALFISFVFGGLTHLIKVPIPDRSAAVVEIPERLVQLVKKEPPRPAPEKEIQQARKEPERQPDRPEPDKPSKEASPAEQPKEAVADDSRATATRKKAEGAGVLRFKNDFKDLMNDTHVARLGTEARLGDESRQAQGQAVAQRSLVAMQAEGGSSGGIGGAGVSRNVGSGNAARLGGGGSGAGFVRVESAIAGKGESSRPTGNGLPPGRTDEEVQIVFDRYKAALYRIYNQELRKNPTLRGKILMRISIEPDGTVSLCKVESTDLDSPELVKNIAERIQKFNFGPKDGVQKMTILYPIDFLPAG